MNCVGGKIPPAEGLPKGSACIVDGMSIVQKVNVQNNTFAEVSNSVLKSVLREGETAREEMWYSMSVKDRNVAALA